MIYEFVINNVKLCGDETIMSPVIVDAITKGTYEDAEAKRIHEIVKPNDIVLELGAGLGYISTIVAKLGVVNEIYVFEADSRLIPIISKTHSDNGILNTKVINKVVLAGNDEVSLTLPFYIRKNFWSSSLSPKPAYKSIQHVETISIGQVLRDIKPTLIIVDIEGGELDLLRDGTPLDGVDRVFVELHRGVIGKEGIQKIDSYFESMGFSKKKWGTSSRVLYEKMEL